MKNRVRHHRAMTSVLALIYLSIMAALAVGFYSAIDTSVSIADNQQYMHRSDVASEAGLAFARYQVSQISMPSNTTAAEVINTVYGQLGTALNGTANMGGHNPSLVNVNGSVQICIPGQVARVPTFMSDDAQGGQVYLLITNPSGMKLRMLAVAQNSHARATPITRKMQLDFNAVTGMNPIFGYGVVSYGQLVCNNQVSITGNHGGVLIVNPNSPVLINNTTTLSKDLYYTSSLPVSSVRWGNIKVAGYAPSSGQFVNHVHPSTPTPTLPTVDTSAFAQYCTAQYGGGTLAAGSHNQATVTNTILATGSHTFNNPVTINGILYLNTGANLTFNNTCTIHGCIVQQNTALATLYTLIFNNTTTDTSISALVGPNFPAGETALSGSFLLLPNFNITVNNTLTAAGTMIANSYIFNNQTNLTLNGGSLLSQGANKQLLFNNTANISINTANSSPAGVGGGNITYTAVPSTYTEVP